MRWDMSSRECFCHPAPCSHSCRVHFILFLRYKLFFLSYSRKAAEHRCRHEMFNIWMKMIKAAYPQHHRRKFICSSVVRMLWACGMKRVGKNLNKYKVYMSRENTKLFLAACEEAKKVLVKLVLLPLASLRIKINCFKYSFHLLCCYPSGWRGTNLTQKAYERDESVSWSW